MRGPSDDVDPDHHANASLPERTHGHVVYDGSVDEQAVADLDGDEHAGDGRARADRERERPFSQDDALARVDVGRDDGERNVGVLDGDGAEDVDEEVPQLVAGEEPEPAARRVGDGPPPERPETLADRVGADAERREGRDDGTGARARVGSGPETVRVEGREYADVGEAQRAAAAEGHAEGVRGGHGHGPGVGT